MLNKRVKRTMLIKGIKLVVIAVIALCYYKNQIITNKRGERK